MKNRFVGSKGLFGILVKNIMPKMQTGERFAALLEAGEKAAFLRNFQPV